MWSISDLDESLSYRLALCQLSDGRRVCRLLKLFADVPAEITDSVFFVTNQVPFHLLKRRSLELISDSVLLDSGGRFFVDSHGMWLSQNEMKQLQSGVRLLNIVWETPVAPVFAER